MITSVAEMTYDELLQYKLALHHKHKTTQDTLQSERGSATIPRLYANFIRIQKELDRVHQEVARRQKNL